jgi:hypothetical protein
MALLARRLGCARSYRFSETLRDRNQTECLRNMRLPLASVQVFGVGFAAMLPADRFDDGPDLTITTVVKEDVHTHANTSQACRGRVRRHTCALRQATVEYAVRLTNDSVELLPPTLPAPIAATPASGTAYDFSTTNTNNNNKNAMARPLWPNARAGVERVDVISRRMQWARAFPMLYTPQQVNLTHWRRPHAVVLERFVDCAADNALGFAASNTSCLAPSKAQLHDLALEYAIVPRHQQSVPAITATATTTATTTTASAVDNSRWRQDVLGRVRAERKCAIAWRDPMQVC